MEVFEKLGTHLFLVMNVSYYTQILIDAFNNVQGVKK
jgi:hypothetical protein